MNLLVSGTPVFTSISRETIRSNLKVLSTVAGLAVVSFLLFAYRSLWLIAIAGLPVLSAAIAGSAATSVIFGGIHGITLVFGITLLGVTIDYPIHFLSHLEPEKKAGRSIAHIWPTLRLGVITTCIGYLAFATQDFAGLTQLGVFTTVGLLAAAIVTRWILPLLVILPGNMHIQVRKFAKVTRFFLYPPKRLAQTVVLMATAGCLIAALVLMSKSVWQTDLSALSPLPDTQRQLDTRLRTELGTSDIGQLIVVSGPNLQAVLEQSEKVATTMEQAVAQHLISGFDLASRYLPSEATQRHRQASLPSAETVTEQLNAAMHALPFKDGAFDPFLQALAESRTLPTLTLARLQDTLIGERIQPLLFQTEHGWTALVTLTGVTSATRFKHWFEKQMLSNTQHLDLKGISTRMLEDQRGTGLARLTLGTLAILAVLSFGLRSPARAFRTLVPVLAAVLLTAGVLTSAGELLSLFHLIALLLTAGIGIDYSLFFLRQEKNDERRLATLHALSVCAVSTAAVFGILATSELPVLRAIGLTVAIGAPLCFLLAFATARWDVHQGP